MEGSRKGFARNIVVWRIREVAKEKDYILR